MCERRKLSFLSRNISMNVRQNSKEWFKRIMQNAASSLVDRIVDNKNNTRNITDKEIDLIRTGVEEGIIAVSGNVFTLRNQSKSPYDAFTLNREYFVQFATLVELITDYGYLEKDCQFEYHLMDICVFQNSKPFIYIETKVNDHACQKLITEIKDKYSKNVTEFEGQNDRGIDALRKAKYVFRDKPHFLCLINPFKKYAFSVKFDEVGFRLVSEKDIPKLIEK